MSEGPVLIFDKSALESLTLDEAVLLDNFYTSNIVPIFFVECLADLERAMVRMRSTPEQLVGSLATRTPDMHAVANVHHMAILQAELSGEFDLDTVLLRPVRSKGRLVQLGDSKGVIFMATQEEEAVRRWARREFIELEREAAKGWRRMLAGIDLNAMSEKVLGELGHWRKPTSLEDARKLTDTIIDNMDPQWLLWLGLEILGLPEATEHVIGDWIEHRRKPLRQYRPYFIHMLSVNIFFCLILPTQLLRNVKQSHHVDLAYLYYLPFCCVFTSRDNFHVQVARLFLTPAQQFVHGDELKADLKKLDQHYKQLPSEVRKEGLFRFAAAPPPDPREYLTTRLWNIYLRNPRSESSATDVPQEVRNALIETLDRYEAKAQHLPEGQVFDMEDLSFVKVERSVWQTKGSYARFPPEVIEKNRKDQGESPQQDPAAS